MKPKKLALFTAAGIAILTFFVFSPTLGFGFVNWDDDAYVYQNPYFHPVTLENILHFFTHPYFRSWTPIAFLSHGIDVMLWQFDPFGHHLTNIVLHSLNAALVFWLSLMCLRAFKRAPGTQQHDGQNPDSLPDFSSSMILGGVVAALFFSLHPLRAESVAWVADRKDLVCSFFMLLSSIGYLLHVQSGKKWGRWHILAGVCYILAIGSKTVAIVLPAAWLLLDWLMFKRRLSHCITEKIPFILVGAAVGFFARGSAPGTEEDYVFGSRTVLHVSAMPFTAIMFYLRNLVLPLDLSPVYHTNRFLPPAGNVLLVLIPLVVIAITIFCISRMKKGESSWFLAWASFVLFLLPTFMGLFTGIQPVADRYTYFASISLCILLGGGVERLVRKQKQGVRANTLAIGVLTLCFLSIPVYAYKSVDQLGIWRNAETFWTYVTARAPFALAYNNLGMVHTDKKMYDEAIKCYEQAIKLKPKYGEAMNSIGIVYRMMGEHDKAIDSYRRAIEIQPDHLISYINLGTEYRGKGMNDSAIAVYSRALIYDSTFAPSYYNIGLALADDGKTTEAIAQLRQAVSLDPGNADAWYNLGVVVEGSGLQSEAAGAYSRAIGLRNDYFDAYLNLGNVMVSQGRYFDAIEIFARAIIIKPSSADAHYNMGYTLATVGNIEGARESFQAAVRWDSTYAKAYHNLGIIYHNQGNTARSDSNLRSAARLGFEDSQQLLRSKGITW